MSTWGPGVFSCDIGADVHDAYRDLLDEQVPDDEATARMIASYADDDDHEAWLALAAVQHKFGRLDDAVRARALAIIGSGEGLGWWIEEGGRQLSRRRAVLAKLRDELTGEQRPRRRVRKPRRRAIDLEPGMVLSYAHNQATALWRVLNIRAGRTEDVPILGWLAWDGDHVPSLEELQHLQVRAEETLSRPIAPDEEDLLPPLGRPATYSIHQDGADDWLAVGFQVVGTITPHPGDDTATECFGMDWHGLAHEAAYHLSHHTE